MHLRDCRGNPGHAESLGGKRLLKGDLCSRQDSCDDCVVGWLEPKAMSQKTTACILKRQSSRCKVSTIRNNRRPCMNKYNVLLFILDSQAAYFLSLQVRFTTHSSTLQQKLTSCSPASS
jgi:hypothetical protein